MDIITITIIAAVGAIAYKRLKAKPAPDEEGPEYCTLCHHPAAHLYYNVQVDGQPHDLCSTCETNRRSMASANTLDRMNGRTYSITQFANTLRQPIRCFLDFRTLKETDFNDNKTVELRGVPQKLACEDVKTLTRALLLNAVSTSTKTHYPIDIQLMAERTCKFLNNNKISDIDAFYDDGMTEVITSGTIDYICDSSMWLLQVSDGSPTQEDALRLLTSYLVMIKSTFPSETIETIGFFNAKLNRAYSVDVWDLDKPTLDHLYDIMHQGDPSL